MGTHTFPKRSVAKPSALLLAAPVAALALSLTTPARAQEELRSRLTSYQATPCKLRESARPGDYRVFVDRPTGFAFVCTPAGWVFARQLPGVAASAESGVALTAPLPGAR